MSWITLDSEQARNFIKAVSSEDDKVLFEPSICDVYQLPLDFYDGYHLTRISNKYTIPYLTMDYLSNGENHYYLDGSEAAFHNLNARGAISLNEKNAFDYLSLYISYVYERGNSMGFLGEFETSSVVFDEAAQAYRIETMLNYQGKEVEGSIDVTQGGVINVKKPLEVTFLDELSPTSSISYRHTNQDKILEDSKMLLMSTTNGTRLVEALNKYKPAIHILPSPNYQGFCTNTRAIYMCMPAEEQNAKYLQAIMLAGCIADMEQVLAGHTHPHPDTDEEFFGEASLGKNLDMIKEMCKIVEEYEQQEIPEGLHALNLLGFSSVYHTYKAGGDDNMMFEVYVAALKQQHIIAE